MYAIGQKTGSKLRKITQNNYLGIGFCPKIYQWEIYFKNSCVVSIWSGMGASP